MLCIYVLFALTHLLFSLFLALDENVKKYCESLKKKAEPPVQVAEVDSCLPLTPERVCITLEDDPEGPYVCNLVLLFWVCMRRTQGYRLNTH